MKTRALLTFSAFVAAAAFAAYPALRGYGTETGMAGAELYARDAWLWSHQLAIVGFVALTLALLPVSRRAAGWAAAGTVLVLPYYGAEAYGLHALGRTVLESGQYEAIEAADAFRYHPVAMTTFALGWVAWGVCGALLLRLALNAGPTTANATAPMRLGAALTGAGLLLFLPQFFTPGPVRISHGVVLAVGAMLLAAGAPRSAADEPAGRPAASPRT